MNPKILVFAGSAREDSLNKKLARVGARAVDAAGGQATFIDLRDYPLPLYDGDLEARDGIPANAKKLKQLFIDHQGLLIASPENNASMSALLKNTIDWISRQDGEQSGLVPYAHKVAALMAASPSVRGGLRGVALSRSPDSKKPWRRRPSVWWPRSPNWRSDIQLLRFRRQDNQHCCRWNQAFRNISGLQP